METNDSFINRIINRQQENRLAERFQIDCCMVRDYIVFLESYLQRALSKHQERYQKAKEKIEVDLIEEKKRREERTSEVYVRKNMEQKVKNMAESFDIPLEELQNMFLSKEAILKAVDDAKGIYYDFTDILPNYGGTWQIDIEPIEKTVIEQIEIDFANISRKSTFLTIYSLFEKSLYEVCEIRGKKLSQCKTNIIKKANEFFRETYGKEILYFLPGYREIDSFRELRNCLIHDNGRVTQKKGVEAYIKNNKKLLKQLPNDLIFFESEFCIYALKTIQLFLKACFSEVFKESGAEKQVIILSSENTTLGDFLLLDE